MDFIKEIEEDTDVIIAVAGKAAHLSGVIASHILIPVATVTKDIHYLNYNL